MQLGGVERSGEETMKLFCINVWKSQQNQEHFKVYM